MVEPPKRTAVLAFTAPERGQFLPLDKKAAQKKAKCALFGDIFFAGIVVNRNFPATAAVGRARGAGALELV